MSLCTCLRYVAYATNTHLCFTPIFFFCSFFLFALDWRSNITCTCLFETFLANISAGEACVSGQARVPPYLVPAGAERAAGLVGRQGAGAGRGGGRRHGGRRHGHGLMVRRLSVANSSSITAGPCSWFSSSCCCSSSSSSSVHLGTKVRNL